MQGKLRYKDTRSTYKTVHVIHHRLRKRPTQTPPCKTFQLATLCDDPRPALTTRPAGT